MCSMSTYETAHITSSYSVSSGFVRPVPYILTVDALKSLYFSNKFIESWIKSLEVNYVCLFQAHSDKMNELLNKVPTTMSIKTYQYF